MRYQLHKGGDIINSIAEIIWNLTPVFVTGIITFLITKYEYHNNLPLDKLEIAYNRVYFPIYRMLNENAEQKDIIEKSQGYFKKYYKYVDRSTLKAFELVEVNGTIDKKAYENYKENIFSLNVKLRKKLGYSEPNVFFMYKYLPKSDKRLLRFMLEIAFLYIMIFLYAVIDNAGLKDIFLTLSILNLLVLVIEFIVLAFGVILPFIISFFKWLSKGKKK